jgi:hypothetical protein
MSVRMYPRSSLGKETGGTWPWGFGLGKQEWGGWGGGKGVGGCPDHGLGLSSADAVSVPVWSPATL